VNLSNYELKKEFAKLEEMLENDNIELSLKIKRRENAKNKLQFFDKIIKERVKSNFRNKTK